MNGQAPAKLIFGGREHFRALHTGEDRSFGVIALLYGVALAALALVWVAARYLPLAAEIAACIVAFFLIGWAQYSLGNGLHEAVHHNLRNKKGDRIASLLTAYPIGLTMAYRKVHLEHHRYFGTDKDPELDAYRRFPQSRVAMLLRFVWFFSGIPALIQFLQQQRAAASADGRERTRSLFEPIAFIGVQVVLIVAFGLVYGNPMFYVVFWALPIATVGKLLSTTRLLCEHGSPTRDFVVRTIHASRWQTWLMGAFDFNYHAEHHLFPSVPYARLRQVYQLHCDYREQHPEYQPFDGRGEFFSGGYLALLRKWFSDLPWFTYRQVAQEQAS